MDVLKCYTHNNKIRLGRDFDGGYIIVDSLEYNVLICLNIYSNNSFETDFLNKNPNIKCYIYDEPNTKNIKNTKNTKNTNIIYKSLFFKKSISLKVSETEYDLYNVIKNNSNIFLKIDLKGEEFNLINNFPLDLLSKISQMVIVFNYPFKINKFNVFKKINNTHYLIHFHPNNCYSTKNINGIIVPEVFECTYINKNLIPKPELNNKSIPSELDRKNCKKKEDICLSRYPYSFWRINFFD
jgi:hypothetical protein